MHRIRLAGPWECQPMQPAGQTTRVRLPAPWDEVTGSHVETLRLRRTFHQPSGLTPDDSVFIAFSYEPKAVTLDNQPIDVVASGSEWRCDITARLSGFHALELILDRAADLSEAVRIVIVESGESHASTAP